MYFEIIGINVNKAAHHTCFTVDIKRVGTPPTNKWRILMCGDTDVICPDVMYNQTYLPEIDKPFTYGMTAGGYCKTIGTKMTATVEYFNGIDWITADETFENYIPEASRMGVFAGLIVGFILLKDVALNISSKIVKR